MQFLFGFLLSVISLFLILLILVQRGRGGGLTGALGGMGGQSAFGTKAGDTFTRVTIVAATLWIVCAILAVKLLGGGKGGPLGDANAAAAPPVAAPTATDDGASLLDNLPSTTTDDVETAAEMEPSENLDGGETSADDSNKPVLE